ncbi:uncharacterized protein PHACADRAFT_160834 [Phanerochaete carnosa HHB-10118-sp]|uniref:Major facilitator superfamily (MFS) profile domain-containing protein n=1 Tax=Phanerochaete carnosa (strain HHB-10118-sp) TaxID=650164 RepID=K5W0K5_PHACS|nr:uncharacterized protein PHACADRAFT_160834 [Phanerochaete carnosa HHB-10118-sp]EKM57338.1 hypothetical protein PHACADRAFT_160834 [Phanerochaete carnosa HHB-10118-sp]
MTGSPNPSGKVSLDEKKEAREEAVETVSSRGSAHELEFGGDNKLPPPPKLTPEQEAKLYRKVDLWLMPILTIMYLFSFLDRGNIGNAKLQGLTSQLHLTGNKYNIALTMYFIPYCIFECPANLVLKKFRPSRWLPGITIVWGIIVTLMGLDRTYANLVGTRIALGIAEAGLFPGVVYYLSIWYPRHMLQWRIGIFYGGATVAGAFSGLLAFGISFMSGTDGMLGWSWIFIIEGIATVCVGIISLFILVDFPDTAKFLTPEEKAYIIWKKKYDNSSVGEEEHFALRHVWAALKDWQIWLQILVYMSIIGPLYGISLFLPFGFDTAISQLLTVPPYVFATIVLLIFAVWSDRIKMRYPFILAGLFMCLIGFSINLSHAPIGVKYFGTFFCVAGSYAAFPGVVAWLGNNLAGQYKRGVGMALHIGIGNFAGAIASNIYREQDAPRYILGHALELMFVGIGFVSLPIVVFLYKRINAQRDRLQKEMEEKGIKLTPEELREMGDRAPDFRYTL